MTPRSLDAYLVPKSGQFDPAAIVALLTASPHVVEHPDPAATPAHTPVGTRLLVAAGAEEARLALEMLDPDGGRPIAVGTLDVSPEKIAVHQECNEATLLKVRDALRAIAAQVPLDVFDEQLREVSGVDALYAA